METWAVRDISILEMDSNFVPRLGLQVELGQINFVLVELNILSWDHLAIYFQSRNALSLEIQKQISQMLVSNFELQSDFTLESLRLWHYQDQIILHAALFNDLISKYCIRLSQWYIHDFEMWI